jgi:hypothetical protein
MKTVRGRLNTLPVLFKNFKEHTITIQLTNERMTIFDDGTIKRFKREIRERRRR